MTEGGGCCCSPSPKHRTTHMATFMNVCVEIAWISIASAAIEVCPYRPVYSAAALMLFSAFLAWGSNICYATCCTQDCFAATNAIFVGISAFITLIALSQVSMAHLFYHLSESPYIRGSLKWRATLSSTPNRLRSRMSLLILSCSTLKPSTRGSLKWRATLSSTPKQSCMSSFHVLFVLSISAGKHPRGRVHALAGVLRR